MPEIVLCRILVADDNKHDVAFLEVGLRSTDLVFDLEHVLDGDEALASLERDCIVGNPPDLLVLDFHLPGKTGDAVLCAVRTSFPECKFRILILTGDFSEGAARRLKELGACDVIPKPTDLNGFLLLGRTIRDICRTTRGRSAIAP